MSNENKSIKYNIHERIFNFVVAVIKYLNTLPKTPTNLIFINQITRSVTSMGANDQEADGALSRKDFIHCYTIVRKEGKETVYWLKIIEQTNTNLKDAPKSLIKEGTEINSIVSSIINNTLKNHK